MLIGYALASTEDQLAGLDAQEAALKTEGCEKQFQERVSSVAQRDQLEAALDWAREGDTMDGAPSVAVTITILAQLFIEPGAAAGAVHTITGTCFYFLLLAWKWESKGVIPIS